MSMRSYFSFLFGSHFLFILLVEGILSATTVSAQTAFPLPMATYNTAAITSGNTLHLFVPMIANNPVDKHKYYVSTSGSDSNPGTFSSPWRTIQKAANTMVAGDTVEIRTGTYNERVLITRSGNATAGFITYTNYPGESPVIDGTGIAISSGAGLINLGSASYIKIAGLKITNSDDAGIYARGGNHILVQNNSTQNTHSSGVGIWSSDNVLVGQLAWVQP
jgi:hypothetical protein